MLTLGYLYFGQYLCYKRDFAVNFKIILLTIISIPIVYCLLMNILINQVLCILENTLFIEETTENFKIWMRILVYYIFFIIVLGY